MSAVNLDRYELIARIAVGGMAEVFRAKAYGAHGFEKTLAVKRILPTLTSDSEFEARFIAEAKLAVGLSNANIVSVFDFGRFGGSLYIAMEYVDGIDLASFIRNCVQTRIQPTIGAIMHVAVGMMQGLDFAHRHGVIHRDISPSNILLSREGEVKVADFGIAEVSGMLAKTDKGLRVMGKWPYMSPEQLRGEVLDGRTDLFSAGIVLYELLAGKRLFVGEYPEQVAKAVNEMPIPPLAPLRKDIPQALDRIVGRLLMRNPAERYPQASAVLSDLFDVSATWGVVARPPELAESIQRMLPPVEDASAASQRIGADLLVAILDSEKGGTRVTMADAKSPARPVGFVRGQLDADGVTRWELRQRKSTPPPVDAEPDLPTVIAHTPTARHRPAARRRWLPASLLVLAITGLLAVVLRGEKKSILPSGAAPEPALNAAFLELQSTPPGALVVLNGAVWNERTPATVPVAPSTTDKPHRVELRLPGYRSFKEPSLAIGGGERRQITAILEPLQASLDVQTKPLGAEASLDGNLLGKTPFTSNVAADGASHALKLHLAGYEDVTVPLVLEDGATLRVDKELAVQVRYGRVNVQVDPWADVYWNGRRVAEAPVSGLRLPAGRQQLRLVNPVQKRSTTVTVDVPAGGTAVVSVKLPY